MKIGITGRRNKLIAVLAFALITSACGGGNSKATNNNGNNIGTPDTGITTVFEGVWYKPCGLADDNGPVAVYDTVTLTFKNNIFQSDIKNFTDSNCTTVFSQSPNPTASGTFLLSDVVITTTSGLMATEFTTRITSTTGGPFENYDYDIYYISVDTLYFGNTNAVKNGTSVALRPDTLDFNRGFIRQ
ncbi:MAG: hypothetical protein ACC653_11225 [Gammaproteobacteria bacterium]